MKKFVVLLMMIALLLSAACGKQPQSPTVPTEPSEPVTQAPTQAPTEAVTEPVTEPATEPATEAPTEAPTEPVTEPQPPTIVEPEGFVSVSVLQDAAPELESVGRALPLTEQVTLVLGEFDGGWQLMTYDHRSSKVLDSLDVECYDAPQPLEVLETDPYALLYCDGRNYWKVTADSNWALSREKYDPALHLSVMGDLMVHNYEGSISVGRVTPSALQANDRMAYTFIRVLNDHQLLYYAVDRSITSLSHYGVYDHNTGETRAVTTMGQQVIGTWGESILVGYRAENGWYDLGVIALEDTGYTELDLGCETVDQAVSVIELNREGTRAVTLRPEAGGNTLRVFSIPDGELLYQWTAPADEEWHFDLTSEHSIVFWKAQSGGMTLWTVEY